MRDLLLFALAALGLDFAAEEILLFVEVFFDVFPPAAGFLADLAGAAFFDIFVAESLFSLEVLLFTVGFFLAFVPLLVVLFA